MKPLVVTMGAVFLFGIGTLTGVWLSDRSVRTEVHVYADRTPMPQELEIRRAAQHLLDSFNEGRWADAHEAFASHCRGAQSAEELEEGWSDMGDFRLELRWFRVVEVHDDTAIVESDVHMIREQGTGSFGPNRGAEPWLNSFTFEDGQWRACQ